MSLTWERLSKVPCLFWDSLGLINGFPWPNPNLFFYSTCSLNFYLFTVPQGRRVCVQPLSDNPPYCRLPHQEWGSHSYHVSVLPFFMWSLYYLLCKSCSISPQLFCRRNCSTGRYRFHVSLGRGGFSLFLHHHLGLPFNKYVAKTRMSVCKRE